jgi:hypothetical protein
MQYWIFFIGGAGGDGFSNLLEHSNNIKPVDGKLLWRSKPNDLNTDKVAFFYPKIANHGSFLRNHKDPNFDLTNVELSPIYRHLVETGQNTIISVHPWDYNFDPKFKYWDFLEQDQHKIYLYSNNIRRFVDDFCDKNSKWIPTLYSNTSVPDSNLTDAYREEKFNFFSKYDPPYYNTKPLDYKTLIDIDRAWEDWDYLNNILINIGINLDRKYYEEYLDVSKRRPK